MRLGFVISLIVVPLLLVIPTVVQAQTTTIQDCIAVIVKNAIQKGVNEEASTAAAAISGNSSQSNTNQNMGIDINNYTNHIENCVGPHQK